MELWGKVGQSVAEQCGYHYPIETEKDMLYFIKQLRELKAEKYISEERKFEFSLQEMNMRFAIISDIHGNLPALDAVLEDAKNNNIDSFIFVGDYCLSNPYPNECIQRITLKRTVLM